MPTFAYRHGINMLSLCQPTPAHHQQTPTHHESTVSHLIVNTLHSRKPCQTGNIIVKLELFLPDKIIKQQSRLSDDSSSLLTKGQMRQKLQIHLVPIDNDRFFKAAVLGQMSLMKASKILCARNGSFFVAKHIQPLLGLIILHSPAKYLQQG